MQQYTDSVLDLQGNAISGVTVSVLNLDGSAAAIYSETGSPIISALYTDSTGKYSFAAANGSYLVTFAIDGQLLEEKKVTLFDPNDDVINVKNAPFNARGDGVTDDTAAIDKALAAAAGKRLRFPSGVYMTSGNHTVPRNTVITGDGWNSEVFLINGSNPTHIFKGGDESAVTTIEFRNIKIEGNKASNTSGHGIHIIRPLNAHMNNVNVRNCAGDNVRYEATGSAFENYILGCTFYGSGGMNFRMVGAITDTHLNCCDIGYSAGVSVQLATSCSLSNCTIWGAGMPTSIGVYTAGSNWVIWNCRIEGHGQYGIVVAPNNHFGYIGMCRFYANSWSASTNGLYDHIYVYAGANSGTITGCKVYSAITAQNNYVARYALNFAGAHDAWTVTANDFGNGGPSGALTTEKIVNGILETDKTDFNWIRTNVKARIGANVNATAAFAWTAFPYDTEDLDPLAEFSNGTFTPKHSGRYRIEAGYTATPAAAGENLGLALYNAAGNGVRRLAFFRATGGGAEMASGSIDEFLTAGTAYTIRYLTGSTSTQFLAGGEFTYVRIRAVPN